MPVAEEKILSVRVAVTELVARADSVVDAEGFTETEVVMDRRVVTEKEVLADWVTESVCTFVNDGVFDDDTCCEEETDLSMEGVRVSDFDGLFERLMLLDHDLEGIIEGDFDLDSVKEVVGVSINVMDGEAGLESEIVGVLVVDFDACLVKDLLGVLVGELDSVLSLELDGDGLGLLVIDVEEEADGVNVDETEAEG
ncbi:MAG: hypothetical protein FJ267_17610, partial [Planctomycetes bacterium]|nr:hypothetical protein [Planctomycetota bacterium]